MKTILLTFVLLCSMQSCKAQNSKPKKITKKMIYPTINKNFETFNTYFFEKNKQIVGDILNTGFVRMFLENGNYYEMDPNNKVKYTEEYFKDNYFNVLKHFYSNNNIKMKGVVFNNGNALMGTWYEFDEQGKLIKEIDYDKDYKFTFEDILKFCERENIRVDKGPILQSTGFHTRIYRDEPFIGKNNWEISWLKKVDVIEDIVIDGTTGKVLSRTDRHYENN